MASTRSPTAAHAATTLVAFVTDIGFMAPALVAARQLVAQGVHELADIVIYTVDVDARLVETLDRDPATRHIRFQHLPATLFELPSGVHFHRNHVPVTSLARLVLPQLVPSTYDRIVYIDGDVQIVGDVRPLIRCEVPKGKILAARGSAWLDVPQGLDARALACYLSGLGGVSRESYFNAGVFAVGRATWADAAPRALQFFFDHSHVCIRHDQSALNAVFKDQVMELAPRYNFHSAYADLRVQSRYAPAIIHFTGPRKPWSYAAPPWGGRFHDSYRALLGELPMLAPHLALGEMSRPRAALRALRSAISERRRMRAQGPGISAARRAFFSYVDETPFPC